MQRSVIEGIERNRRNRWVPSGVDCLTYIGAKILKQQSADGSWRGNYVGLVYTTAINTTILQLNKGYLPIYQR